MGIKILLTRWEDFKFPGGDTTRYGYFKQMFPNAEMQSYENIFEKKPYHYGINAIEMATYHFLRYKKDKNIILIRNPSTGYNNNTPQITIWGNPFKTISETIDYNKEFYEDMSNLQKFSNDTFKVAVSNFMAADMKKLDVVPDIIIPNCVDINLFKPLDNKDELKKKYNIPLDKKIGIFVGINSPVKNEKMIERIIKEFPNNVWLFVSKDTPKLNYPNLISIHCNNPVALNELYNCADFYILTSPVEGCSNTTFEAMSCNIPVITSQCGYFWDFWDKRIGQRVKWNNFDEYKNAINIITKNSYSPRDVIIERKLDLENWKKEWYKIIKRFEK